MDEILIPIFFFLSVAATVIGYPMARAWARRKERDPQIPPEVTQRLERMEQALDAIAIEVERISEGQRFTTTLLADRGARERAPLPPPATPEA